jgi:ERCC4-type nuclease
MKPKPFLDIFSKSKKQTSTKREDGRDTSPQMIIVDYREKNSLVISELARLNIESNFQELKVADYIVNEVAIERKTISDFISSMLNKRLFRQLEELQQYPNRLLILEGIDEQELYSNDDEEEIQGVHPNAVRGFLLSILLRYKVPIIFSKDAEDTAKFISVILKKKTKEASLNVSKKSFNKKERLQFILEGFPGIGPKTAQKLLKEFKTLKNIMNTAIEEIEKVIGKKAEIFRIAGENY